MATIKDPREAATVLMLAVARADSDLTAEQRAAILGAMRTLFSASPKDAEELLARGLWLTQDAADVMGRMRSLTEPVFAQCTVGEQDDLLAMLKTVASVHAEPSPSQLQFITKYQRLCDERRA